jgi:hypothetical protein
MSRHNLELLVEAARLLQPLLGELVFVGGSTTALLITDKAAAEVRPTYDVDAIAEISSYAAYADFSERLRRCGFREDTSEGAPICRWRQKKTILDVMPLSANPVILAAKPGTFAQPWPDPDLDWSQVGPLSARITNYVRASVWDEQPPTLGEVLSNVTDYKGTGEISPKGSISWSDFEPIKKATVELRPQSPVGRVQKETAVSANR